MMKTKSGLSNTPKFMEPFKAGVTKPVSSLAISTNIANTGVTSIPESTKASPPAARKQNFNDYGHPSIPAAKVFGKSSARPGPVKQILRSQIASSSLRPKAP